MPEILTESFCERCGTRYTFEAAEPKGKRLGKLKTFSKGFVNFVSNDETSLDEAFAEARSDEQRELTNQQLDAFHQTFQFCMSCRQYTCANCWNESESRCLSCAPHLGTDILEAPFPGLDPLARIGFGAPPTVAGATNGHANGHPDEPAGQLGAPSSSAGADAWPTADRSSVEPAALALPAGDVAATPPEPAAVAEPPLAEPEAATGPDAAAPGDAITSAATELADPAAATTEAAEAVSAAEPEIDPDVAAAAAAVEEAHRAAALAEVERERAAEFERARRAAEAAEQARQEMEATERQRQVAAEALAAEERADAEDQARADEQARAEAEIERQQAEAAAERARKVAAEAERQRIAFEDAERARQAAALAAAASLAPAQPTGPDSDRLAAAADRTSELMDRFRPGQDDKLGPPQANPQAWQITAPEVGSTDPASAPVDPLDLGRATLRPQPPLPSRPGAAAANGARPAGAPDWPSPATTPPPQWPMPASGESAETGLWAASSREVAAAAAPTGVQACSSCGLPLSANARFCRRCGTQQH